MTALDTLGRLRQGRLASELTDHLARLVAALREQHGAGKATLTLTLALTYNADTGVLNLEDQITAKPPALPKGKSILFVRQDGSLSSRDERQPDLPAMLPSTPAPASASASAASPTTPAIAVGQ
jgi:hypothetical protein